MERAHGGNIKEYCEKYGFLPSEIVDFSTNVNFKGVPSIALSAISQNLDKIQNYPDCRQKDLREALSDFLAVPKENILVGNGSADLIFLLCRYFLPRQALVFVPTFCEYEFAVKAAGGRTICLNLDQKNNFALPINEASEIINRVDLVFVCSPNNPTGTLFQPKDILKLLVAAQEEVTLGSETAVIVDEAFIDFTNSSNSLRWQVLETKNLVVLGSLTKFFSIPGLRLGYAVADSEIIRNLNLLRDPWSINCFAEIVGKEVVKDKDFISTSRIENCKNREYLIQKISSIDGFKAYPSEANFILVEICNPHLNSVNLQDGLAKFGIMIRDCSSFRSLDDRFIRLAVRSKRDIDYLASSIEKIVGSVRKRRIPACQRLKTQSMAGRNLRATKNVASGLAPDSFRIQGVNWSRNQGQDPILTT